QPGYAEHLRSQDMPVRHDDGDVRLERPDLRQKLIPTGAVGLKERHPLIDGELLDRGMGRASAPTRRPVGLGDDPDDLMPFFAEAAQRRNGEVGRPPEEDSHPSRRWADFGLGVLCSSAAKERYFFSSMLRF